MQEHERRDSADTSLALHDSSVSAAASEQRLLMLRQSERMAHIKFAAAIVAPEVSLR